MHTRRAASENSHNGAVYIICALCGAVNEHAPALFGNGHHALCLEICLLLISGLELFLINLVRLGKRLVHITVSEVVVEELLGGGAQIENRLELLIVHLACVAKLLDNLRVGTADHRDGLTDILDSLAAVYGSIVENYVDIVVSGHILGIHIEITFGQLRYIDRKDLRPRNL